MKKLAIGAIAAAATLCMAGCLVGPKYKRPAVRVPAAYRGAPASKNATASLGDEKWWRLFQDPVLVQLIHKALANNYDVRIAATRVLEAQAMVGIVHAGELPSASFGANIYSQRNPKVSGTFPAYEVNAGGLDLSVLWNLDFWGKYRHQTEEARAQMRATQWGQQAVRSSLVASLAAAYFQLRALDRELEISKQTQAVRQKSLHLTEVLEKHGSASALDVSEARQLAETAAAAIPDLERRIGQQENLIRTLTGENPGPVPRGRPLSAQPEPPRVPAGLPSQLLERRPDIRQAEESLVAANARIGVLRAAFLPNISLTGLGGLESNALNRLISSPAEKWNGAASLAQPVFAGGALRAGLKLSKAQWKEMVLSYRQTVQQALRQVSDSLIAYRKDREFRARQAKLASAAQRSDDLSQVLYRNGGASYLQVLTSQSNSYAAEIGLVQARLNERLALVALYQALGGGWQR